MTPSSIAFFDLDHTLVDGDSDSSFVEFLVARGALDAEVLRAKDPILAAYMEGRPWQAEYRELLVQIYRGRSVAETEALASEHAESHVLPMLYPGARALVEAERERRGELILLTTTNQVVTGPVAQALGLDGLLSTRLETADGRFTGELVGDFCTGPGKAEALRAHCAERGVDPRDCAMFGDGRSDMEALHSVGEPVAVHPTEGLAQRARDRNWPILSLA